MPTGFIDAPVVTRDAGISDDPCLGLLVNGESGETIRIPKGATMFVITNPKHVDGVLPLILAKVTAKALYFVCGCRRAGCTRTITYAATRKGQHPARNPGA